MTPAGNRDFFQKGPSAKFLAKEACQQVFDWIKLARSKTATELFVHSAKTKGSNTWYSSSVVSPRVVAYAINQPAS